MHFLQSMVFEEPLIPKLIKLCLTLSITPKGNKVVQDVLIAEGLSNPVLDNINLIKKYSIDIVTCLAKELIDIQRNKKSSKMEASQYPIPVEIIKFMLEHIAEPFIDQFDHLEYPKV